MSDNEDIDQDERAREDTDDEHDLDLEGFLRERARRRGKRWPR